jgi:hypothetical protein
MPVGIIPGNFGLNSKYNWYNCQNNEFISTLNVSSVEV